MRKGREKILKIKKKKKKKQVGPYVRGPCCLTRWTTVFFNHDTVQKVNGSSDYDKV